MKRRLTTPSFSAIRLVLAVPVGLTSFVAIAWVIATLLSAALLSHPAAEVPFP